MKSIQTARRSIELEFDEPIRDIIAGFIAQGESLNSTARILEVSASSLRTFALKTGLTAPSHTRNRLDSRSAFTHRRHDRRHINRGLLEYTRRRPRVLRGLITYKGRTMAPSAWARETGIDSDTIRKRITRGWPIQKTLTIPPINTHERAKRAARTRWSR